MKRLLVLLVLLVMSVSAAYAESFVRVIHTQTPPTMDGKLDDLCWKGIPVYEQFTTLDEEIPAKQVTRVQCVYDSEKIYFAITCNESPEAIKRINYADTEVRKDDSAIELYFQPVPVNDYLRSVQVPELSYYILALNAAGAHYGQCGRFVPIPGSFDVKTTVGTDSWQAEISIPFASLKVNPLKDLDKWKLQIKRNAFNADKHEGSTLFPAPMIPNNIDKFGLMVFVEDALQKVTLPVDQSRKVDTGKAKQSLIAAIESKKQLLAVVPHIAVTDSKKVLPTFVPEKQDLNKPVRIKLVRNEFEPASFVIWSPKAYKNITLQTGNFIGKQGKIPSKALDLKWVKCWYQAGTHIIEMCGYELTPELLLNNPDLVKVDLLKQRNVLGYINPPKRAERTDDAATLQPLKELPAEFAQQVWITAKVPSQTKPGLYRGNVAVMSGNSKLGVVPIEIEVLDFDLKESVLDSCLYVCSGWGPSATENSPVCAKTEMKDLAEHGIRYVGLWEHAQDMQLVVKMMHQAGLATDRIFIGNVGRPIPVGAVTDDPQYVYDTARVWSDVLDKAEGVKEVYHYLVDEVGGDALASERPIADALHRAGAKTWVACQGNYFPFGGDFIDLAVASCVPDRVLAKTVHQANKRIYCYARPQCGLELPETYRRNYGLLLWQAGYDGAFDFAYNCGFDDPWNDCDHVVWKDHMMAYPTKSGVIDTIQWEGWREGVDDCRYLATLEYWQAKVQKAGNTKLASEVASELTKLKNGGTAALSNMDSVRDRLIQLIRRCRKACK